jgi:adenylylsulfate kinase-like enzyme
MEGAIKVDIGRIKEHFDLTPGNEPPLSIWIIGRPAAGKTTTAEMLQHVVRQAGYRVELVDGEVVRAIFDGKLGHSRDDRLIALDRLIHVNRFLQSHGIIPITATIMGLRQTREILLRDLDNARLVFLDCPFDVAADRDQKGLYAKALAGEIRNFPGVDLPFESPTRYDMRIDSAKLSPGEIVAKIVQHFQQDGLLLP